MKHTLIALSAALMLQVGAAGAQTTGSLNDDVQQLIAQVQSDKAAIVISSLQLTDAETRAFTPIYDEYQAERKKLAERRINTLNKFAANYGSMTDKAAEGILKEWFKIKEDDVDLVKKFAKRFERVIPATKVLRFVQVENKLDNVIELEATRVVPLAK
jgi:hypothetical protein